MTDGIIQKVFTKYRTTAINNDAYRLDKHLKKIEQELIAQIKQEYNYLPHIMQECGCVSCNVKLAIIQKLMGDNQE